MHPSINLSDPLVDRLRCVGGAVGETAGYLYVAANDTEPFAGKGETIGFGEPDFYIRQIERRLANEIIAANHYSGRVTIGSTLHLGIYVGGRMLGVLQYGYALNYHSAGSVVTGTLPSEYLELNRMWLDDRAPRNSESRALGCSIRFIRRARPAVKWIQSFADERCGLCGTVYQAAGFSFHGSHVSRFYELDGEWYHKLLLTHKANNGPRARRIKEGIDRATAHDLRQFRYLKFLKPRFAKGCRYPVKPFPKPGCAAGRVDEPVSSGCEAGATPAGRSPVSSQP